MPAAAIATRFGAGYATDTGRARSRSASRTGAQRPRSQLQRRGAGGAGHQATTCRAATPFPSATRRSRTSACAARSSSRHSPTSPPYTLSAGPSITAVTGRWQYVWAVNAVRTTSEAINGRSHHRPAAGAGARPRLGAQGLPRRGAVRASVVRRAQGLRTPRSARTPTSSRLHLQAERVFRIAPEVAPAAARGTGRDAGAGASADLPADLPLLRRRRQQRARLLLQRAVAARGGVRPREPDRSVPATANGACPGDRRHLHQGRRQGHGHRHGGGDPRPAAATSASPPSSTTATPSITSARSCTTRRAWACGYACR